MFDDLPPTGTKTYMSHNYPERPVLDLEIAKRERDKHRDCGDDCDAKRYYTRLVPQIERRAGAWNIWIRPS
ncbi:hypothetical protein ACWDOP_26915 [Nocardia sp. NPDC003693]